MQFIVWHVSCDLNLLIFIFQEQMAANLWHPFEYLVEEIIIKKGYFV